MTKYDIIWNVSLACPWNCEICCVDAKYTKDPEATTKKRQELGLELDLNQKIEILEKFKGKDVKWNFSGGDPLVVAENLELIKQASKMFGKENVQISTTGAGLSKVDASELSQYISTLKFSYDASDGQYNPLRPNGYNNANLNLAKRFEGVKKVAETPLTKLNIGKENVRMIYENLTKADIDVVLLMRLFPVGRGMHKMEEIPSGAEYKAALDEFKKLEKEFDGPLVKMQCALTHLYNCEGENPCNLYRESFAIMPNGRVNASAWAYGCCNERPLSDEWVLGDLRTQSIDEILNSDKAQTIAKHMDDNYGHCKIFAFLNSSKEGLYKMFDAKDPIYSK